MPRLRTVSPDTRGWTRRRSGRGFTYLDAVGDRLPPADAERCRALVIPPAWKEVWICPAPNGHIQAVGTDDAGRRQYLYHPLWREQRDRAKHERILEVAERLPAARTLVSEHIALPGMPRERTLATAFRLLDLGFFRVGGEGYVESGGSYGLATIEKKHVRLDGSLVVFDYVAKHGKQRVLALADESVHDVVGTLLRRRGGDDDLLAYKDAGGWHDITSSDINAYVKDVVGGDVSAKDFRTWHATVLAAVALAVSTHAAESPTARKRAVSRAMTEVSEYLGNTPTVARASYVDPRVVDLFEDGTTIEPALSELGLEASFGQPATHGAIERAVLDLLRTPPPSVRRARRR
ncbi:DNA topoisomerase IB [Quadrisphaera sp. DSM 44207]|uniref:DNA topoisomerase IB n=1 Tax=Quadrisphaera sp. DSM 44207 TaxID=1881057 RepID=UPI0008851452|nr:DNA topoisomerase IB [Quadrisphaera sp. DSM 44207]SDQ86336.1 DNA topoisomerase IB [Quadrisphaera sp. DSM 44207]